MSSDKLGETDPIDFEDYVEDDRVHQFDEELYDDHGQKAGSMTFSTQVIFVKPDPPLNPTLNYNCMLQIKIKEANFFKDSDLEISLNVFHDPLPELSRSSLNT